MFAEREKTALRSGAHGPSWRCWRSPHLRNRPTDVCDADFRSLIYRQNDGLRLVVLAQHPYCERAEVVVVDELAQWGARAPHGEVRAVAHGVVALVNEAGNHVAVLNVEVVVRAVDVRGNDARELAAVLLIVAAVQHVDHALGIGISLPGAISGQLYASTAALTKEAASERKSPSARLRGFRQLL
eukprot:scaffold888_cov246-Pinguiococcus_pyrenoidosus.AAC.3